MISHWLHVLWRGEGTSGGRGVSKYDFIEPANAVNDGNWKANVIINVRRLI